LGFTPTGARLNYIMAGLALGTEKLTNGGFPTWAWSASNRREVDILPRRSGHL